MNPYEEELQNNIERGHHGDGEEMDAKVYRQVFDALKKDPGYSLPPRFAEKVIAKIAARQKKEQLRDYFWFAAGLFLFLVAAVVTLVVTGFRLDFGFLQTMADYKGLALFGLLFVVFLNWLDKRLVRQKLMHH